jgi:hypothetical protein
MVVHDVLRGAMESNYFREILYTSGSACINDNQRTALNSKFSDKPDHRRANAASLHAFDGNGTVM